MAGKDQTNIFNSVLTMPVVMKREKFSKSSSRLNSGILIERSSREFYYVEGHSVRDQASFEQIWG